MNNFLSLIYERSKTSSKVFLFSLLLLIAQPTSAIDLQCDLAENSQIKPGVITAMLEAADKGNLYRVDTSTSNVAFKVNHFPFSSVEGSFNEFDGGLTISTENNQSRQALFFIKVGSMETGDSDMDEYLKSEAFFDVTQFPDIVFVSTGFEWINETSARLYGELTLRGTTRSLVLNVRINETETNSTDKNPDMILSANAEIQRSEFGMHQLPMLVSDTVRFNFKIAATRVGS